LHRFRGIRPLTKVHEFQPCITQDRADLLELFPIARPQNNPWSHELFLPRVNSRQHTVDSRRNRARSQDRAWRRRLVLPSILNSLFSRTVYCMLSTVYFLRRRPSMKSTLHFSCLVVLFFGATASWCQVPEDLADKKDFRALRIASTDPKFKNADYRRI